MIKLTFLFVIILTACEHVAKKTQYFIKPSVVLTNIYKKLCDFWYELGVWVAFFSSYLRYIWEEFYEYLESFYDILKPSVQIIFSALHFFDGYLNYMNKYTYYFLVPIGSLLLVIFLWYICVKYNLKNKLMIACRRIKKD
jgi:hypothetical protein